MKKLSLLIVTSIFSVGVWASPYDSNSFGMMPHKDIMRMNIDQCKIEANATGNTEKLQECIEYQQEAFKKLLVVYNDKSIAAPSWSLCIGESKTQYAYNYVVMYACMKVVKDICKEKPDGQWENPNLCINSIESGAWVNNPKVYQPYKSSKQTPALPPKDLAP